MVTLLYMPPVYIPPISLGLVVASGLALILLSSLLIGTGLVWPWPGVTKAENISGKERIRQGVNSDGASIFSRAVYSAPLDASVAERTNPKRSLALNESVITRRRLLLMLGAGAAGALAWASVPRFTALTSTAVGVTPPTAGPSLSSVSPIAVPHVFLGEKTIRDRLGHGQPILTFADLDLDWDVVRRHFALALDEAEAAADYGGGGSDRPAALADLDLPPVAQTWFENRSLEPFVARTGASKRVLHIVLNRTMHPFLAAYAEALLPKVDQSAWRKGICPVCGGKPDYAYLERDTGARYLVCERCDSRWLHQRLECPFCGSTLQHSLGYYTDNDGTHRVYVCDGCKSYIKAVDLRKLPGDPVLPLERSRASAVEKQVQEAGYSPGWLADRKPI